MQLSFINQNFISAEKMFDNGSTEIVLRFKRNEIKYFVER